MAQAAPENADDQKEQKEEESGANFTGSWKLETTHNLDAFLKSQGVGFAKRKIIAAASMTLKLDHKGDALKVETITPINNMEHEMTINGEEKEFKNPITGDTLKFSVSWKDDTKMVMIIKSHNLQTKRKITRQRSMPNENEMIDEMTNDKGATMTRKFKRIE